MNRDSTDHEEYCACGQPLHYVSLAARKAVERIIHDTGTHILVTASDGREYLVQRHYIALHGLKAAELPALAACGIVQRVKPDTDSRRS